MAYNQNNSQRNGERVRFDLMEHIGVLSVKDTGWIREANIVSWNGGDAKVDIREWAPDHKRMGKGITLFENEAELLTKMLARRYGFRLSGGIPADSMAANDVIQASTATPFYADSPAPVPVAEVAAACVAETAARMSESAATAMA